MTTDMFGEASGNFHSSTEPNPENQSSAVNLFARLYVVYFLPVKY